MSGYNNVRARGGSLVHAVPEGSETALCGFIPKSGLWACGKAYYIVTCDRCKRKSAERESRRKDAKITLAEAIENTTYGETWEW